MPMNLRHVSAGPQPVFGKVMCGLSEDRMEHAGKPGAVYEVNKDYPCNVLYPSPTSSFS
jgi:hypothetical protein